MRPLVSDIHAEIHYYLCQGDYVFGGIGLFVLLSASNITQIAMKGLKKFYGWVQGCKRNK